MLVQRPSPAYPGCTVAQRRDNPPFGGSARLPPMPLPHPVRALGLALVLVVAAVMTALLGACETAPILRGGGSEHRQNIRVGLPF
jgi:hypothetical protein